MDPRIISRFKDSFLLEIYLKVLFKEKTRQLEGNVFHID